MDVTDEEEDGSAENEEEQEPNRRPPWMENRVGIGPGGSKPVQGEQIPEWAWNSPKYWYARYVELEKAYRDLGQRAQNQNWQQGNAAMSMARSAADDDERINELLALAGIAVSIGTLLFALRGSGYHSLSSGVILGISFVGMVIAQRIHIPEALSKIQSVILPPYGNE